LDSDGDLHVGAFIHPSIGSLLLHAGLRNDQVPGKPYLRFQ
jgi:hypothetical protein